MDFYEEISEQIGKLSKEDFSKLKVRLVKKHQLKSVPTDVDVFLKTGVHIQTKPMRTLSGVAPLALMTAPFACPHGKCLYCPGGPNSAFGDVPQSYTGHEPSTMRGIRNFYDPYLIVFNRLEQFVVTGHLPQKTEVIIQGGTFPALPVEYQEEFITNTFKAMNDFGDEFYHDMRTCQGIENSPSNSKNASFCYDGKTVKWDKFKSFFELPGVVGN